MSQRTGRFGEIIFLQPIPRQQNGREKILDPQMNPHGISASPWLQHKAGMFNEAIAKNRRGYRPVPHQAVTEFWHAYWSYVQKKYGMLKMKEPGDVPEGSDWPEFLNDELGMNSKIVHKLGKGQVDMYFRGYGLLQEELAEHNQGLFAEDIQIVGTKKTAFVQIKVPVVDRFRPFSDQQKLVDQALQAAVRLLNIHRKIKLP